MTLEHKLVSISTISVRQDSDDLLVSAQIEMPGLAGQAWYRLPVDADTDVEAATDAFYIIGLILAMGSDGELVMDQSVSQRLAYNTRAVQDIMLGWYPKRLRAVSTDVPLRTNDAQSVAASTVTCFTGGVDSFDTLINNSDAVGALLYVHGFDIPLSRTDVRSSTSAHLKAIASMTNTKLIEVSTNIRRFLNLAGSWPVVTHGAALSSVGHLLSANYGRLLVPASHTYADSYAWGSHPLLDHLWSSNRLSVVHDGAGSTRVQKTINLASSPAAQQNLRVCWQNTGKYNCGKCDKCLRTMIALSLTGVLPKFETFESEVPLDAVRSLTISGRSSRSFVVENLTYAEQQGAVEIADILRKSIQDFDSKKTANKKPAATVKVDSAHQSYADIEKRLKAAEKSLGDLQRAWTIRAGARLSRLLGASRS